MKRKPETFGLVLAAVLALGAVGASAATAATTFHTAVHPQFISSEVTSSHVLTTNAGTGTCAVTTFAGVTSASTSATQTLGLNFDKCTMFGFINVPVHENNCYFTFNANGTSNLTCSGNPIEITTPFCTTTIGTQHIASGMSYANSSGDILATTNISGIKYNECGTNRTNGTYKGQSAWFGLGGALSVS